MALIDRMKDARIKKGFTQEKLAKEIGVAKSTYTGYEKGNSEPNMLVLSKIMGILGVDANYLFQDEVKAMQDTRATPDEMERLVKKYRFLDEHGKEMVDSVLDLEHKRCVKSTANTLKVVRKPLPEVAEEIENIINLRFSELKTSAGTGYQLDDDQTTTWKVLYNEYTRMADFCLEVDGQSMEPKIFDGDIILIRQQPAVDVGEIGLFTVDDTGYVKQQGEDRLISINPAYDDIFPSEYDTVICRGKVIGVLEPDWIVEQ